MKKSDIKLWVIGRNGVREFFENFYDLCKVENMQKSSELSIKHKIITDMMCEIHKSGFTFIESKSSRIGESIGFVNAKVRGC